MADIESASVCVALPSYGTFSLDWYMKLNKKSENYEYKKCCCCFQPDYLAILILTCYFSRL